MGGLLQAVSLSLAVFPDSSLKGKQVCCCSGHNFNHSKHCSVMLVSLFSNSCLVTVVGSYAMFLILIRRTACDAFICLLHGLFLKKKQCGGLMGTGGMSSFYFHLLGS